MPSSGELDYPTSDGRPMGETDLHRNIMFATIETLKLYFEGQRVYVSGNILLFYQPGNRRRHVSSKLRVAEFARIRGVAQGGVQPATARILGNSATIAWNAQLRRHVSPDVLVTKGLDPRDRDHYLLWQEGRSPNVVIEVTSESTRDEDLDDKFEIYRDKVLVAEYFLYDPRGDYLDPSLQGYRLSDGEYERIDLVAGRLPSIELGLDLEDQPRQLRFFDPLRGNWLPTGEERRATAEAERQQAEAERRRFEAAWRQATAEADELRQDLEALQRRLGQ